MPIASFLRVGVCGQYRFASGVDLAGLTNADLAGPGGALYVRFGAF